MSKEAMTTTQERAPMAPTTLKAHISSLSKNAGGPLEADWCNSAIACVEQLEADALRQPQATRLTKEELARDIALAWDATCHGPNYPESVWLDVASHMEMIDRLTAAPGPTAQIDDSDEDDYGEGGGDVRGNLYEAEARSKSHDPYPHLTALAAASQVTREEIGRVLYEFDFDPPVFGLTRDQAAQASDAILSLLAERGLVKE